MRAWVAVAMFAVLVSGCSGSRDAAPANATPAAVPPAPPPIDAAAIPATIRVLAAPGVDTVKTAAALEQWINERIAPKKVSVVVSEWREEALIEDLLAGKGEIAANLLITFQRDDQVAFAAPVRSGIKELVVTGPKQPPLVSLEDVGGRTIHVRKTSDHYASLVRLNDQLIKINRPPARIVLAPPAQTDQELLAAVNAGKLPATLADDYVFDVARKSLDKISANRDVAVSQDGILAWATRKDSPELLKLLNAFFSTHKSAP